MQCSIQHRGLGFGSLSWADNQNLDRGTDTVSGSTVELASVWEDLVTGKCVVVHSLYSEEDCYLGLEYRAHATTDRRLCAKRVAIVERILLGESQKSVAIDVGLAVSTVALIYGDCLRAMGKESMTSRVPLLMMMAAHAAQGIGLAPACVHQLSDAGDHALLVSCERPDRELSSQLSVAEAAVTRLVVEGRSHQEIAVLRGTSKRTIANQLASVFRKLRVSGRGELLAQLVRAQSTNLLGRSQPALPSSLAKSGSVNLVEHAPLRLASSGN